MADSKLSALTEITVPSLTDNMYIVTSGGSPDRKLTLSNLKTALGITASTRTTYSSRSSGVTVGDLWLATDSPYSARWDGSTWNLHCMGFPVTDPNLTTWGWINQGTAAIDTSKGFHRLSDPTGTGLNFRIRQEGYTSSNSIIRTALIIPSIVHPVNFSAMGIGFRDSVSGKLSCICWLGEANGELAVIHAASATSDYGSAQTSMARNYWLTHPVWFQIEKDSTNIHFRFSSDGQNFFNLRSEAKNSYLTNDPDNVFFFIMGDSSMGAEYGISLMSWG